MKRKLLVTFWLAMLVILMVGCAHTGTGIPPPEPTKYIGQVPQTIPPEAELIGKGATAVPFYFYITPEAKAQLEAGHTNIDYFLLTASYDKDGKLFKESHGPVPGENIIQFIQYCLEYASRAYALEGEAAWLLYIDVYVEQSKV